MRKISVTFILAVLMIGGFFFVTTMKSSSAKVESLVSTSVVSTKVLNNKSKCSVPAPTTAQGWFKKLTSLKRRWAAADQVSTVKTNKDGVVFMFGDTVQGRLKGTRVKNHKFPHNSFAVLNKGCMKFQANVIPDENNGFTYFWPISGKFVKNELLVFVQQVNHFKGTPELEGTRIAHLEFENNALKFKKWTMLPSTYFKPVDRPQWGASMFDSNDGWTYVYGTKQSLVPLEFGRELYVSRNKNISDPAKWEYWNGTGWVMNADAAKPIHAAAGGVSASFSSFQNADGSVTLVTKKDDFLGDTVVSLRGSTPFGSFVETELFKSPSNMTTGDVTYTVLAHPELELSSGKTLITVSRNNLDGKKVIADYRRGRPKFMEINLP